MFQRLLTAQNRRIDQLVEKIKQQQEKLEKQSLHLQALQNKVSGSSYTETSSSTVCIFSYSNPTEFTSMSALCFFQVKQKRVKSNRQREEVRGEVEQSYTAGERTKEL